MVHHEIIHSVNTFPLLYPSCSFGALSSQRQRGIVYFLHFYGRAYGWESGWAGGNGVLRS